MGYSRKSPKKPPPRSLRVGVDDIYIFLKKLLEFIDLSLYPCLKKTSFHAWLFRKLVLHPKNQRPIENSHDFFLITPRKSTSFLIDSGISACFFQYFLNFMSSTPPVWFFSEIGGNQKYILLASFWKKLGAVG